MLKKKTRKIREAGLERATKISWSRSSRVPLPMMDWNKIREAKISICHECSNFDSHVGGCGLYLMPNKKCVKRLDK